MTSRRESTGLLPALTAGVLLLVAHIGASMHTLEHEFGSLDGKVCVACVTAAQLGAAAVDCPPAFTIDPDTTFTWRQPDAAPGSQQSPAARQRGPPVPNPA